VSGRKETIDMQVDVYTIFTRYKLLQNAVWYAALVVSVSGESSVRSVVVHEYDNGDTKGS